MGLPASDLTPGASAPIGREPLRVVTGGGGGGGPLARGGPLLPGGNGVLGMAIFLAAETMLFAGLISALLILRAGSDLWPPPDQPRLPIGITFLNTLVLVASGVTMWRATAASGAGRRSAALRALLATLALGATFLAVQGFEWTRLMRYGLSASRSTYGGMFYTLIGCHALHAVGAVTALLIVAARYARGRARHAALEVTQLYWLFVVGVWPVLYVLVYLL